MNNFVKKLKNINRKALNKDPQAKSIHKLCSIIKSKSSITK